MPNYMFIRTKKITKYNYAYLVESTWDNGRTKQKVKSYLGRVFDFGETPEITQDIESIQALLELFYAQLGFEKKGTAFTHNELITISKKSIVKRKKECVIQINEGFLCKYTIKSLLELEKKPINQTSEDIHYVANTIVEAGIKLSKPTFIQLFSKLAKIEL